jgi:hypothetical protein
LPGKISLRGHRGQTLAHSFPAASPELQSVVS